jgi:phage terminase large subunit-like protein
VAQDSGLDRFKHWTAGSQEAAFEALRFASQNTWTPFYCPRPGCDGNHHMEVSVPACPDGLAHRWLEVDGVWVCATQGCGVLGVPQDKWLFPHARADQHPPEHDDWLVYAMIAGRGSGKTRASSEWYHRMADAFPGCRMAVVAPTGDDFRNTNVEGESGILAVSPPGRMPDWEPSKKKLTWPNGSQAFGYSGEEPDRLRGKQHHFAGVDEPAHIPLIEDVWYNLLFGLRLGASPKVFLTTSPKPVKWLVNLMKDPQTIVANASTYANIRNLPPHFAHTILSRYEGTRLGRQEIEGHVLEDVEGALWTTDLIDGNRDKAPEQLDRVNVSIDPAGTANTKSDETGITVQGVKDNDYYILDDLSGRYSPNDWAEKALHAYDLWKADAIVPEVTYGRDMVIRNLSAYCKEMNREMPRIIPADSRRGKVIRAEPIVGMYERRQVHHTAVLSELETQLTTWVPGNPSPDRLDALVHGLTDLMLSGTSEASISSAWSRPTLDEENELQELRRMILERNYG